MPLFLKKCPDQEQQFFHSGRYLFGITGSYAKMAFNEGLMDLFPDFDIFFENLYPGMLEK
jgi:hypothetical protein